jgi:hypothetical protein
VPLAPFQRPVGLLKNNTAHSSGYHWGDAAAFYFGGILQYGDDNVTLTYSIERHTFDPKRLDKPDVPTKFIVNDTKVWLGGTSISAYGAAGSSVHGCRLLGAASSVSRSKFRPTPMVPGDRFLVDGVESYDGTMGVQIRGDPNEVVNAYVDLNSGHSGWLIENIPDE